MDTTKPSPIRMAFVSELVSPLTRTPVHAFDTWALIWYTRGQGHLEVGGRTLGFRQGDLACVPPRTAYAEIAPRGFMSLWVLARGLPLPPEACVLSMGQDLRLAHLLRLLLEEYRAKAEGWQESAHVWLGGVLRLVRQHQPRTARVAEDLAAWLRRHASDPAATAAVAMARMGGSPVYLRRRFRQVFGMSPSRYLTLQRIDQARLLLRLSALPIAEIARQCGVLDPLYFSRLFHRHVGCGPQAFRARLAGA